MAVQVSLWLLPKSFSSTLGLVGGDHRRSPIHVKSAAQIAHGQERFFRAASTLQPGPQALSPGGALAAALDRLVECARDEGRHLLACHVAGRAVGGGSRSVSQGGVVGGGNR